MKINGTIINYYFHCKRQCYLLANRLNLEDNSELVKVGKAIHEQKLAESDNSEIAIENIKVDKITKEYLTEIKKSDADINASKWQLLFYLKVLKDKGIIRKGKLECIEKKKSDNKVYYFELTDEIEKELDLYIADIQKLIASETIPDVLNKPKCKKCAYYEYCYI
ncbi:CRISPR-associated protein Cas4 [Intestinibacter sp.]|uniref:CRISPR-associated protein Cas4 n=1 Tax=Intestinibacter sp. TaxID=1965304 RepID=UPI002A90C030|nr:CRISPR-associated protein Cas4 [Intestinibacter sp.]MDY5212975.1 CRISPR-associated protein Cas4 [Intestinibacter sp.]